MVFTGIWKIYHPLMRADFCLFDSYENDLKEKTFTSDVTAFHGTNDRMISKSMVEKWETMTTAAFAVSYGRPRNADADSNGATADAARRARPTRSQRAAFLGE